MAVDFDQNFAVVVDAENADITAIGGGISDINAFHATFSFGVILPFQAAGLVELHLWMSSTSLAAKNGGYAKENMPLYAAEAEHGECRGKAHDRPPAGRVSDTEAKTRSGKLHTERTSPARAGGGFAPPAHPSSLSYTIRSLRTVSRGEKTVVYQVQALLVERTVIGLGI